MPTWNYYFVKLLCTRPGWPQDMTPEEERIMNEHFGYLKRLTAQKKVVLAGPCGAPDFGLIVLRVASREEADSIMTQEPSIVGGVHTYEIKPLHASLLMHNIPADRYPSDPSDWMLLKERTVPAPIDSVWHCWTTNEGMQSFLSPGTNIELRPGGPYEIYFNTEAPYGTRGSEDCKVLSFIPKKMLSFEWNAPPQFGELRDKRTMVVVQFTEVNRGHTKLSLTHLGWGQGESWNKVFDYFDSAWGRVLDALERRFADKTEE